MSGVYIKGMEMPTSCEKCPFLDYEEGFCFASAVKGKSGWYVSKLQPCGIKGGRPDECPLVPVPPHGRLIDADALCNRLMTVWDTADKEKKTLISAVMADIVTPTVLGTPTIISASEEGE